MDDQADGPVAEDSWGELTPGTIVGGYRIEAVAGRGGMGVVYRATQLSLDRAVALKVINPALAADPAFRERFRRESALAASLDHPNVVTVHEAGEDAGRLYVSMRFVPGTDLGGLLAAEGPLQPAPAVGFIGGVARALDAAHAAGLVHRDVKPSNVLVERRGDDNQAFLSDFGVVKRTGQDAERTGSAGWVGSADFVAPEQVLGDPVDGRADIYALGGVLYTALTGKVPFERPDLAGKLYASVNEAVPSLHDLRPELPAALDDVIARATAKDPSARYGTAGEFAAAARAAADGTAPATSAHPSRVAGPPPAPALATPLAERLSRRRVVAIGGGILLAAIVAIVVVSAASGGGHHNPPAAAAKHSKSSAEAVTQTVASGRPSGAQLAGEKTFQFSPDGTKQVQVTIYDLRRDGPFLTLDFKATCVSEGCSDGFDAFAFAFYEGEGTFDAGSLAGIKLLDPVNKKVYRAVQDAGQNVWQSKLDISLVGSPSQLLWVKFPAPPASVTKLDVLFPIGGPQLPDLPITTASAGPSAAQVGHGVEADPPSTFAKPPTSTDTDGLVLPVNSLVLTVGNRSGADQESPTSATVTLNTDVLFKFAKATLTQAASATLRRVAADITRRAAGPVGVDGYTDSIGADAVNIPLSEARARAVVGALRRLTPGVTYTAHGHGSDDPVAPNTNPNGSDDPAGRALNRRVTIKYKVKAPAPPSPPATQAASPTASGNAAQTVTYRAPTGSEYQVRVDHIYRDGDLVVAEFSAKCLASYNNGCNWKYDFGAESPSQGSADVPPVPESADSIPGFNAAYSSVDAVYLQDSLGSIYDPTHDDANLSNSPAVANAESLGSTNGPKLFERLWAYFPAPPASTTTLSFVLPGGKTRIPDVPVEAGAP
jgi:outer membrane protein OmpA-like peptidoglycan-associated protein